MAAEFVLETRGLVKAFKGFTAVDDVNLQVHRGHIHAMIGPNGAGKTTVFNLLTKFLKPTRGQILFNGKDITPLKSAAIAKKGIIRSFQISAVFPEMTALENVRVALQSFDKQSMHFWKPESALNRLNDRAVELLDSVGLAAFANTVTAELSYGRKRALELATTLAMEPELVLLDEPTQGMGHEDVERVVELVRKAAVGRTVLMVEHNLGVVSTLCDRITVLSRGSVLAEGDYDAVSTNPEVREVYMGTDATAAEGVN